MQLTHNLAISSLGIYQIEMKTYAHKRTQTQMFTAALFMIAPNWKQLNNHHVVNGSPYKLILLRNKKEQATDTHQ